MADAESLRELPESENFPKPEVLESDPKEYGRSLGLRLTADYERIVRALRELDEMRAALETQTATDIAALEAQLVGKLSAPAGTRLVFDQDTVPTGWTRDTVLNDRVLRVVSGARADGGSWTIGGLSFAGDDMGSHTHGMQGHTHSMQGHTHTLVTGSPLANVGGIDFSPTTGGPSVGSTAGPSNNTTTATGIGTPTGTVSQDGSWRPQHRDVIIGVKD